MARQVTIGDVAKEAGVSIATVSRVLNGQSTVNQAMVDDVRAAAGRLGYRPNAAARGLASGAYRVIGVVVPDLRNPYFTDILESIVAQSKGDGYRVLVSDSGGDVKEELDACRRLRTSVDGLILVSPRMPGDDLRALSADGFPKVLINRQEPSIALPMALADTRSATLELCRHLSGLGHSRVVYMAGSALSWQNRERLRGIHDAREFGFEAAVVEGEPTIEAGYRAASAALDFEPTAIMAYNDLAALGVIARLREIGFKVPNDISVTGFDDIEMARYVRPTLTTAVSLKTQLGEHAWNALSQVLRGQPPIAASLIPSPVVVRESTGPALREATPIS